LFQVRQEDKYHQQRIWSAAGGSGLVPKFGT